MKKIMIDPGHGGSDPGAVGLSGVMEKNVVLEIAKHVGGLLAMQGLFVALTRTDDSFVGLNERAKKANDMGADYFVSIHANSAASAQANGTETYALAPGGEGGKLAASVQDALAGLGRANRGVKFASFAVLKDTKMPAVLTEVAFLSNPAEEQLLNSPDFQNAAAKAIAEGILNYLGMQIIEETKNAEIVTGVGSSGGQPDYDASFAKTDIEFGMEAGIFSKTETFRPKDYATREELAAVIARMMRYLEK